jgi:DNA-binding NtrC family response regulator
MGQTILGAGSILFRGGPVLFAGRRTERHRAKYRAMKKNTTKAKTRILLIGENPDAVLSTALQHDGYEALECDSPQSARDLVDAFRPHLLVVHLRHPADVATLQECHLLADGIPIVVATSVPGHETVMRALEGGATSFLFLPLEPAKIKKLVDDLLGSHETH